MASNEYTFLTHWRVEGAPDEVYAILDEAMELPRWWPSVYLEVKQLTPEPERGPGKIYEVWTKGWLPYTIRWRFRRTSKNPPHGFSIEAWGDFVGTGAWSIAADGKFTNVTYDWRIRGDKPIFKYLSFLLKPIFSANHRWAMKRGEESLQLELRRRHVATDDERAKIPPPPGPTFFKR
jgi:hypothetical protein